MSSNKACMLPGFLSSTKASNSDTTIWVNADRILGLSAEYSLCSHSRVSSRTFPKTAFKKAPEDVPLGLFLLFRCNWFGK